MRTEDAEILVAAGQTGVAVANEKFEFHYRKGECTTAIWCEGFLPRLQKLEFRQMCHGYETVSTTQRLAQLQEIGLEAGHSSGPELNAMRDAIGHAALRAFLVEAHQSEADRKIPKAILIARRFIKENISDEKLDMPTIARNSGITQQYLISAFKKHIGITPSRYLWRVRASTARQLLIQSGLAQSEIAFKCGFKSMPHFSRTIKKLFGMSPAELRKDLGFTQPSDTEDSVVDTLF